MSSTPTRAHRLAESLRRGRVSGHAVDLVLEYRRLRVEHDALKVVGRGLFLSVFLLLAFLLVLDRVTNSIAGINEIVIPTAVVPTDTDLGAVVRGTLSRASAAVITVVGVATFLISATATARALRIGTSRALGASAPVSGARGWVGTIGVAAAVSVAVLAMWVVALGTALRSSALREWLGIDPTSGLVGTLKLVLIVSGVLAVAAVIYLAGRLSAGRPLSARAWIPCVVAGASVAALNLLFLYSTVGALLNPRISVGIVMVLTLLTWVNLSVRAYFLALCSVSLLTGPQPPQEHG